MFRKAILVVSVIYSILFFCTPVMATPVCCCSNSGNTYDSSCSSAGVSDATLEESCYKEFSIVLSNCHATDDTLCVSPDIPQPYGTGDCSKFDLSSTGQSPGSASSLATQEKQAPSVNLQGDFDNLQTKAAALNHTGINNLAQMIGKAGGFFAAGIGSISLVFYIYGGFMWMTAMGNSDRAKKGQDVIVWTTLGVVAILSSYIIVKFLFSNLAP